MKMNCEKCGIGVAQEGLIDTLEGKTVCVQCYHNKTPKSYAAGPWQKGPVPDGKVGDRCLFWLGDDTIVLVKRYSDVWSDSESCYGQSVPKFAHINQPALESE